MSIKIDMLRCFVTVAECGNLSDAAARMNRTPSAVSMMLKQFEAQLNRPLFESDRKNKLSRMGAYALEQAQIELRQFDRTLDNIMQFAATDTEVVRIACVPSFAATLLPQALTTFREAHPSIRIELRDMDSQSILQALEQERIDIGIATPPAPYVSEDQLTLTSDSFGLVCPTNHPLAKTTQPLAWEALTDEQFITNELCRSLTVEPLQHLIRRSTLSVYNTLSLLTMVKAGMGVTVLPQLAFQLSSERLTFCPLKDPNAQRCIKLLVRPSSAQSTGVQTLRACLVAAASTSTVTPPQ